MATRVYRIGTIYTRVDGAYRKGLYKHQGLPLWFQVYERFPPKYEPKYTTVIPEVEIPEIFYEEDILRAEIHKIYSKTLQPIDLMNDNKETQSQMLLKTCQKNISQGMTKEEALKKLKKTETEGIRKSYKSIVEDVKQIIPPAAKSE